MGNRCGARFCGVCKVSRLPVAKNSLNWVIFEVLDV